MSHTKHEDLAYGPHGERNLLDLYLPAEAAAPLPWVVVIHGGGFCGGEKTKLAWLAAALADAGFAAAAITYRLAPDHLWPAHVDDAQRAVRWLRSRAAEFGLDPDRTGAIGCSAGGYLASCLGLLPTRDDGDLPGYPSQVRCVVDCYGPVDLVAMTTNASGPLIEGLMGVSLAGHEALYREASPHHHVPADPPPFLILHGTKDTGRDRGQVPIQQSEAFVERLREQGGDATLLRLKGGPHGFMTDPASPFAQLGWAAAVGFLGRWLQGERGEADDQV